MLSRNYSFLGLLLLITNIRNYAMEIEKAIINEKPLIKATVYFNAEQPAFYATKKHIASLNKKGIPTPVLPIVRWVLKAVVHENNKEINWCNKVPHVMIKHYVQQQTHKSVPLEKTKGILDPVILLDYKLHDQQAFPRILPIEWSFNCTNKSHISLTIGGFPVEITFQSKKKSKKNFYEEQQQALSSFFNDASSISLKEQTKELITAGLLEEKIVRKLLAYINPLNGQPMVFLVDTIEYIHGPKGCPDEETLVKSLVDAKIQPHTNIALFLKNREMGNLKQSRLYKKNFDGKIEDSL